MVPTYPTAKTFITKNFIIKLTVSIQAIILLHSCQIISRGNRAILEPIKINSTVAKNYFSIFKYVGEYPSIKFNKRSKKEISDIVRTTPHENSTMSPSYVYPDYPWEIVR